MPVDRLATRANQKININRLWARDGESRKERNVLGALDYSKCFPALGLLLVFALFCGWSERAPRESGRRRASAAARPLCDIAALPAADRPTNRPTQRRPRPERGEGTHERRSQDTRVLSQAPGTPLRAPDAAKGQHRSEGACFSLLRWAQLMSQSIQTQRLLQERKLPITDK